jgi:hypothetical protein
MRWGFQLEKVIFQGLKPSGKRIHIIWGARRYKMSLLIPLWKAKIFSDQECKVDETKLVFLTNFPSSLSHDHKGLMSILYF